LRQETIISHSISFFDVSADLWLYGLCVLFGVVPDSSYPYIYDLLPLIIQVIHIGVSYCGVATLLLLHHYYKKEKQEEDLREIGKIWIGRIQVGNLNVVLLLF
jgi:hypothetical protein